MTTFTILKRMGILWLVQIIFRRHEGGLVEMFQPSIGLTIMQEFVDTVNETRKKSKKKGYREYVLHCYFGSLF
jgi:hypothetical protein